MSGRLQTPSLELAFAAQARNREFVRATPVVPLHGEQAEVLCSPFASGRRGPHTVCIVSGGNIDAAKLTALMSGRVP